MPIPGRRLAQTQGDQLRFRFAIELAVGRRFGTLLAFQRLLEALEDEPLTNVLNRLGSTVEGIGNLGVSPPRAIGICLQQNVSATDLLRGPFELLDDPLTHAPLFVR